MTATPTTDDSDVAAFIARWREAGGTELANYQLFVIQLAQLLGVPAPEPVREDTREIAERLATVAKALEADRHAPADVAGFLSRCLFTMFAEDVGLPPPRSFGDLLEKYRGEPDVLARQLEILWANMDRGALPLSSAQIDLLAAAFSGRGAWKKRLPPIVESLEALGRLRVDQQAENARFVPV